MELRGLIMSQSLSTIAAIFTFESSILFGLWSNFKFRMQKVSWKTDIFKMHLSHNFGKL